MATLIGFQHDDEGYWIAKDPDAEKDYNIDFSKWLVNGDTIDTVLFTVPAGVVKTAEGIKPDGKSIWVKVSGGTLGKNYPINAHIHTVQDRQDDQSFRLVIRDN